jgi:S1-C subfamily serine protease
MVATPLASSPFSAVAGEVRQSALVHAVDKAVPGSVRTIYDSLRDAIDRRGLPDVLDPLTPTQSREVAAPNEALAHSAVVAQVEGSVVQIRGIAPSCSRQIDGSGFVYAPGRVMTNAHVLAGVAHPVVTAEGRQYPATPVYDDQETDIAVLFVPGLPQTPLAFAPTAVDTGADSIIMGYPGGGGLYVGAARVRDRGDITGPNFRNTRPVVRDVYALNGSVRAGNSGGPLFDTQGRVLGVVFASAIDEPSTGYALTYQQVSKAAAGGQTARVPVDTGPCE